MKIRSSERNDPKVVSHYSGKKLGRGKPRQQTFLAIPVASNITVVVTVPVLISVTVAVIATTIIDDDGDVSITTNNQYYYLYHHVWNYFLILLLSVRLEVLLRLRTSLRINSYSDQDDDDCYQ